MRLRCPVGGNRRAGLLALALSLSASPGWAGKTSLATEAPIEVLEPTHPNRGSPRSVVEVRQPGRYALRVESPQGAALRVTDRMAGPGAWHGGAGREDGREDRFLERGQVRLEARAPEGGSGELRFVAEPFRELSARPIHLEELRRVSGELRDREQVSYWLDVPQARWVNLEAVGRALADLRVWKLGDWLVPGAPKAEDMEPVAGQPVRALRLDLRLEPGLYRVTAYGGPAKPWTSSAERSPFTLRWGVPELPAVGRRRFRVGPTGRDYWKVGGQASYVRLELPRPAEATLRVSDFSESDAYARSGREVRILRSSLDPVASTRAGTRHGHHRVVVEGAPGQEYVLQHFGDQRTFQVPEIGTYWMGTIHAGDPRDSVDASAILVEDSRWFRRRRQPAMVREAQVVEVDRQHAWSRRFNLASEAQVYLHTEDVGSFRVHLGGTRAEARIEPFFTSRPPNYRPPDFQASGSEWTLDPGYHVLTIRPKRRGICEVVVRPSEIPDVQWGSARRGAGGLLELEVERPMTVAIEVPRRGTYQVETEGIPAEVEIRAMSDEAGEVQRRLPGSRGWVLDAGPHILEIRPKKAGRLKLSLRDTDGAMAWDPSEARLWEYLQPVRPATRITSRLVPHRNYTMHLATQPGVPTGLQLRKLPLDLREPIFVGLRAGDEFEVAFRADRPGVLEAIAEDGHRMALSVDGGRESFEVSVEPGDHGVRISGPEEGVALFTLGLRDADVADPLRPVPAARLELATPPVLRAGPPRSLALERGRSRTFSLDVDEAGLYRVETLGLLHTRGTIRSRMHTSLANASANGTGRNFLVQRRLGVGEYRVDVALQGRSAGPLGVRLGRSALRDGGQLRMGVPARMELERGQAGVFRFQVSEAGLHRVQVLGQDWDPPWVVEDAAGWPAVTPGGTTGARTLDLVPGEYRLVLDPGVARARRVVRVTPVEVDPTTSGKGPFPLVPARLAQNQYRQPGPDRWTLDLAAPATVRVTLQGERLAVKVGAETVPSGEARDVKLDAGTHTLEVAPTRQDDRVTYTLAVTTLELLPGQTRTVQAPIDLPVSIGEAGVYQLETFGSRDVRAVLRDESGAVLQAEDDSLADWNPRLTRRLEAGRYRLRVEPVGTSWASCEVSLVARRGRQVDAVAAGERAVPLGDDVLEFDLSVGGDGLWELTARAPDTGERLALELERAQAEGWRRVGRADAAAARLVVPGAGGALRARLWSLDRRGGDAVLHLRRLDTLTSKEASGRVQARDWTRLELERPGVFRVVGAAGQVSGGDAARAVQPGDLVALPEARAWARSEGNLVLLREGASRGEPLAMSIPDTGSRNLDLFWTKMGPQVAWVRAPSGQPGITVEQRDEPPRPDERGPGMAVGSGAALGVMLAPGFRWARVWDAGAGGRALSAKVQPVSFPPLSPSDLGEGSTFGVLAGEAGKRFRLPVGTRWLRASLEPGMVAVLAADKRAHHVFWADREATTFEAFTAATELYLLQVEPQAGRFSLDVLPAAAEDGVLPLERRMSGRGRLRVAIPADSSGAASRRLRVSGPGAMATFVSRRGRVWRGTDLSVPAAAGWVEVEHGPGTVRVWLEDDLAPAGSPDHELRFDGSGVRALAGTLAQVRLVPAGARLARLRTTEPVVARLGVGEDAVTWTADDGLDWAGPVGFGEAILHLRGVDGAPLRGRLEVLYEPLMPLGEGLGPEVLVPPGGARGFLLEVPDERRVGLGVRSLPSGARTELRRPRGELVGEGVQQMHTLEAGRYVWIVRAPADGPPCRVRPAVVGLEPPGTGPPDAVLEKYRGYAEGGSP